MTPQPIDPKLLAILGKSKKVMNQADNLKPIALSETTKKQTEIEEKEEIMSPQPQAQQGYTNEQVMNSKLPDAIKKAMMNKSVPQSTHSQLIEEDDDKPMIPNKRFVAPKTQTKVITENRNTSDLITISKADLDEMINAKLLEFLTKSYNKTLTEETIKRTINMLIKEGKITVNKKK